MERPGATQQSPPTANTSRKRKSSETKRPGDKGTAKRAKTTKAPALAKTADNDESRKIIINRAPVLQLWSACVTHFIYAELAWSTCLSAGSAISTICAVAKGRSIGTVAEKDESERQRRDAKKEQKDPDTLEVMHFKLRIKDGLALVGSSDAKGKPGTEEPLKKKFGEEQYGQARELFDEVLRSWEGDEDELSKRAFGFYEQFRPDVRSGQKGWGRKGELSLDTIRSTVGR